MTAVPVSRCSRGAARTFTERAVRSGPPGPPRPVPSRLAVGTRGLLLGLLTAALLLDLGWIVSIWAVTSWLPHQPPPTFPAPAPWLHGTWLHRAWLHGTWLHSTWLQVGLLLCVAGLWRQTRAPGSHVHLTLTDDLTGLPGRRALSEQLQALLGRQDQMLTGRGPGRPIWSALLIGVDHLHTVREIHGHAVADAVLRTVTGALRQELRGNDVLGRWGDAEFLSLLPGTDFEGALVAAERLRRAVALRAFPAVGTVTLSIGVASWLPGDTLDRVVARADAGLGVARHSGRNRVAFKN